MPTVLACAWTALGCSDADGPFGKLERVEQALGAQLDEIQLTGDAVCPGTIADGNKVPGVNVALVPAINVILPIGSLADPTYKTLLATSCRTGEPAGQTIHFVDPVSHAVVANVVPTIFPPQGWGAFAWRGDRGDLLACANNAPGTDEPHAVYRIHLNPLLGQEKPYGTAEFLFNVAAGGGPCDGFAWDASDDTIYMSPDLHDSVFHYTEAGQPHPTVPTVPVPAGCPNSGVAVSGSSLFLACNGVSTVYQVDKITGAEIANFSSAAQRTEDIDCDPVNFPGQDAVWTRDAFQDRLFAFAIPENSCGVAGGTPSVPATCAGDTTDTDGDGLLDCWETTGIDFDGVGGVDLNLATLTSECDGVVRNEAPNVNHKDLYLEVDWMAGHQPACGALQAIIDAFAIAPVMNPDNAPGINLHIFRSDEAVAHNDTLAFRPCTPPGVMGTPDFDQVKAAFFGTAADRADPNANNILNSKRLIFRYMLNVHGTPNVDGSTNMSLNGCAELPGNDFVISYGVRVGEVVPEQRAFSGLVMHELGHTLDLRHGGQDHTNQKPNYLSVMNYAFATTSNIPMGTTPPPIDYSRAQLLQLDENNLDESAGIGFPTADQTLFDVTIFFSGSTPFAASSRGAIDWNRNMVDTDTGVMLNISAPVDHGTGISILNSFEDWSTIQYNMRDAIDFAEFIRLTALEPDPDMIGPGAQDADGDGVLNHLDNCPLTPNPLQRDRNRDGIGDKCEATPELDCVMPVRHRRHHGQFVAHFGYRNPNGPVSVAVGPDNRFVGRNLDRGQVTSFQPGRVERAFSVEFRANETLAWKLNGEVAVANVHSPRCDRRHRPGRPGHGGHGGHHGWSW